MVIVVAAMGTTAETTTTASRTRLVIVSCLAVALLSDIWFARNVTGVDVTKGKFGTPIACESSASSEVATEPPSEAATEPPSEAVTEPPSEAATEPPSEAVTKPAATEQLPPHFCEAGFNLKNTSKFERICAVWRQINNETSSTSAANKTTDAAGVPLSKEEISHVIFVHFPKTGGESLTEMLNVTKTHFTMPEFERLGELAKQHVAVTVIRNPFCRMKSWFRFCLHGYRGLMPVPKPLCEQAHRMIQKTRDDNGGNHSMASLSMAFELWLELILPQKGKVDHWMTMPQVDYVGGISPLKLDYIVRFENYAEDVVVLKRALGQKTFRKEDVTKKNGSAEDESGRLDGSNPKNNGFSYPKEAIELLKCHYRDLYTDGAKSHVEKHFAGDLEAFRYVF